MRWRPLCRALFLWEVPLSCAPKSLPGLHAQPGTRGPFSSHLLSGGWIACSPIRPPPPGKTQRPRGDPPGCLGAGVSLHLRTAAPPAFGDGQAVVLPQGLRATPHDRPVSQMQMLPSCEGRDCPLGGRAGTIFRPPGLWPMYSATAAAQGRTGSDQAASWPLSSCHLATGISVTVRCALWAL